MCCKLLAIDEIEKPVNAWCPHCAPGRGCKIYEQRPASCRAFTCRWILDPGMADEWKPDRSKLVVIADENPERVLIHVDPGTPDAWRREPYHSQLRKKAAQALRLGGSVIVIVNGKATLILPDGEQFIGDVEGGDRVVVSKVPGPGGARLETKIVRSSSP
jgi:hypothetical protein